MAGASTIGALRVVLGFDSAQFTDGLNKAQAHLRKVGRQFEQVGGQMQSIGQTLSIGVTAPLLAFGAGALKASSDFESAMIKVGISTKAAAQEMEALEASARQIGKSTVFSASEAADAMDMLAKTGVTVADILGGAAEATVNLAAAAGSELEPAASAISDSMQQFKISAEQLPGVVNQITGAVNESKLDFQDFTLAIGQAGGVAAGLGVSFEDFNAVLAATSSNFASGSDAGTSFKTFLTTLVPKSKQAAEAMAEYGLTFFDAEGGMKSMSDIAAMLQTKLGGLSQEARSSVLTKIFGTDAMRTAIGLMDQGAEGLDAIKARIAETDAAGQSAQRMTGFAGQMEQLKGSLEELGIAIGKSGLLQFMTNLVANLSGFIDRLSGANPELLKFATIAAAVAAAIGPLAMAAGAAVSAVGTVLGLLSAPITLPIVAAVAGLAATFAIFGGTIVPALQDFGASVADVLGPKIQPLFQAVGELVRTLAAAFAGAFGPDTQAGANFRDFGVLVARVLGATVEVMTGTINVITNVLKALGALLTGDFTGAWKFAGEAVASSLRATLAAVETLFPEMVQWVRKTYEGVRDWLGNMLPRVFDTVIGKVKEVGDAFFQLYDRVVGHSYVPDMVEGVAQWMAKLDAGMVKPAKGATKATAKAFEDLRGDVAQIMAGVLSDSERAIRDLNSKLLRLREGVAAGMVTDAEFTDFADRAFTPEVRPSAQRPVGMDEAIRKPAEEANKVWGAAIAEREEAWQDSLKRMGTSFKGMFQEWVGTGKLNWKRLLLDMLDNWEGVLSVLKGNGLGSIFGKMGGVFGGGAGGGLGSLASGIGQAASGIGGAIGKLGSMIGGFAGSVGSTLGGVATSIGGAIGGAASAIGAAMAPLMGVLGPIGIIAGLGSMLLKSKPSNHAALATFDAAGGYSLAGNKRTDETSSAASAAADAIQAGQEALKAFGISLGATVRQVDIGTRDMTHIFLSTGQELRSAVGDPAAAAETALKAVLQGATYTDEAQRSLVENMLATGKGFDEVATALQSFAQAQLLPKAISDQILKLTDPAAFDAKALVAEQKARRAEMQAQLEAGFLTAEQFASINAQLLQLEGLELGDLTSRYADQMTQASEREAAIEKARSALKAAYDKSAGELRANASELRSVASDLRGYSDRLREQAQSFGGQGAGFASIQSEFRRVAALAQLGNAEAQRELEKLGSAYVDASEGFQPDVLGHLAVISEVLNAVEGAEVVADRHATLAERQLEALEASVAGQLDLTEAVKSVPEALANLLKVQANGVRQWGVNPASNQALSAATGYAGDFGAGGWQAWIVQQDEETKAIARHVLAAFGQPERIVGFAQGADFQVGGTGGIDSQLVQFRASPNERVRVTRPDQESDLAGELRGLRADFMAGSFAQASRLQDLNSRVERMMHEGLHVRGFAPADPVAVKVA